MERMGAARWTDDEIADVLGLTLGTVLLARRRFGLTAVFIGRTGERCRRARQRRFEESLERLNGHEPVDSRTPLRQMIAREEVARVLTRRCERTRRILRLRGRGWTLARIGGLFGLTRERVRQIVSKAIRAGAGPVVDE